MSYEDMRFDDELMRALGPKARPLGFDVSESIINNQYSLPGCVHRVHLQL